MAEKKLFILEILFLTDNFENRDKWQMPDYTLAPESFLLIWADEDGEQGEFHANFKLSKNGEEIGIFGPESMGFPVIDSLSYGSQLADISYGCYPNGSASRDFLEYPTPGYSNTSGAGIDENDTNMHLGFYPNPCYDDYLIMEEKTDVLIYNLSGQIQIYAKQVEVVDVAKLAAGLYVITDGKARIGKLLRY